MWAYFKAKYSFAAALSFTSSMGPESLQACMTRLWMLSMNFTKSGSTSVLGFWVGSGKSLNPYQDNVFKAHSNAHL